MRSAYSSPICTRPMIYCHCSGRAQPLYVSHKDSGYYYLAKQGNTGALHHRSCDFWEQDTDDAQGRGSKAGTRVTGRWNG